MHDIIFPRGKDREFLSLWQSAWHSSQQKIPIMKTSLEKLTEGS